MKKLAAIVILLFVASTMLLAFPSSSSWNGWVTDAKCGAKGANAGAIECTKKCLAAGSAMVFVTDEDQKVIPVANPDTLKGHEGHHVAVTGSMDKDKLHVDTVTMVAEK